jgi:hypothetical protein
MVAQSAHLEECSMSQMAGLARWVKAAISRLIGIALALTGYALIAYAAWVLLNECWLWLQDGEWQNWRLRTAWLILGLDESPLPWLGVEKIRTWILDQPLWSCAFPGVAVYSIGHAFMALAEKIVGAGNARST